ncbi:MAG: OsmC family protein [Firmicutes bacterium]|nr:OsmC family protein [Bacillota bacterium]
MALETLKAKVKKGEGLAVEAESRGFNIKMDEPKDQGGTDTGMNPMELILCGLGGCQTIVASAFAKFKGIDLKDFWIELEGDLDTDGFKGKEGVRPGYQEIRYKIHIKSDSPEDEVREFVDFIEKTCPVGDSLGNEVKLKKSDVIIE